MRLRVLDANAHFSCGSCTKCCDQPWGTLIESDKAAALEHHNFSAYPQLAGRKYYTRPHGTPEGYFVLAKGDGTRCLFLDRDGLCIIHKEMGPEAKPHGCLKFPFLVARLPQDDRVSVDFGCPAVQSDDGKLLAEQADDIAAVIPLSRRPADTTALVPLDPEVQLTQAEADALFERLEATFADAAEGDIWERFADALTVLVGTRRYKKAAGDEDNGDALIHALRSGARLPDQPQRPDTYGFAHPAAAPSPARMLFAATLFRDTCPADAPIQLSLWKRLTLMPKLMSLARLNGAYASRLLGCNLNIGQVLQHEVDPQIDPAGTALLLRYYRTRLWQRYLCGTRMSIASGLHQHIHDLNAIIFVARARAQQEHKERLDLELIRYGLNRVEFLLANQPRLFDEDRMIAWLKAQMESPAVAIQSLRLMSLRQAPAPVEAAPAEATC
ncbi:MAG TPA: YkgJ family cysteine cluster protein [Phycisphaerae bacterium]|nr:YkgJ family cysteine cluster protein [Phycisphaerales bacterium]HRX84685.1 YkgJ family cysteine cluster protein [Phycisphaerae bacterium]